MAAVSPKELRQLVNRLEAEAASRPWLYKLPVLGLALVSYAYLFLIFVLSLGLPVLVVLGLFTGGRVLFIQALLKLAVPLLALAAVIVRSLWVRIPRPENQAPSSRTSGLRAQSLLRLIR